MRDLQISPDAADDLVEIWDTIAGHSLLAADRMIQRIDEGIDLLRQFPGAGHLRHDVTTKAFRFWSVWPYVIAYRFSSTELVIIRIFHGSRDFRKLFNPDR